jgi:hypothetical protein
MSFQDIRRKQISEVIDLDKSISRKVFDLEFQNVKQSEDVYKAPSSLDKMVMFQINRYIDKIKVELTATFDEVNNDISNKSREEIDSGKTIEKWNELVNYLNNYVKFKTISEKQRDEIYSLLDEKVYPPLNDILNLVIDAGAQKYYVNLVDYDDLKDLQNKIDSKNLSSIKYEQLTYNKADEKIDSGETASERFSTTRGTVNDLNELEEVEAEEFEALSIDELGQLYQRALDAKRMAEEIEEEEENLPAINDLIARILQDERAAEFPQLYGEGRMNMRKAKYSKVRNMTFDDSRNDFYKK